MPHYRDAQQNLSPEEAAYLAIEKLPHLHDQFVLSQLLSAVAERVKEFGSAPKGCEINAYHSHRGNK